jgi:sulfur-oxidizing protein SoxX
MKRSKPLPGSWHNHFESAFKEEMMRTFSSILTTAGSVLALAGSLALLPASSQADEAKAQSVVEQGKAVAFDRTKGNCLACHQMEGGSLAGNVGPPLIAMKARFPDKARLRSQIWDSTKANVNSIMPPFGRDQILSESEIDKIVEFVYTL